MFTNVHGIIGIAIFQHPLGNGCGRVLFVCQHANLLSPFDKGLVELKPRTTCQRDNAHIVIRHHQPMSQHLQRVKRRIKNNLCLRHLALDGIGKAKEQWVAGSENHHLIMILFEDGIEGNGDVDPLGIGWQQRFYDFMVALTTRENSTLLDYLHDLWREPRLRIIRYTYDNKLHYQFPIGLCQVLIVLHHRRSEWHCRVWQQDLSRLCVPRQLSWGYVSASSRHACFHKHVQIQLEQQ